MGLFSRLFGRRDQLGDDNEIVAEIEPVGGSASIDELIDEASVLAETHEQSGLGEKLREVRDVVDALDRRVQILEGRQKATETIAASRDESNDLQGIDADDELEASAIRTSLDDLLSPEEKTASQLLRLMRKSFESDADKLFDGLVDITVLGRMPGGWWAWEGPEGIWGVIERDVLAIDGARWEIQRGDRIRVRATWRPWHSVIESFDPSSLIRAGGERVARMTQAVAPRRFGNFLDDLRPGHVVLAYVPYGPNAPLDMNGRTGKERPCVFVGWTPEGHALVRGVYTYEPGRYIKNLEGIELRKSRHLFSKPRVAVKRTIVEVYSDTIKRIFGPLDSEDLKLIGIQPTENPSSKLGIPPSRFGSRPASTSGIDSPLSYDFRVYVKDLKVRLGVESGVSVDRIGQVIVDDILNGRFPGTDRPNFAILMTSIGQVFSPICRDFSVLKPDPFLPWFDGLMSKKEGLSVYKSTKQDGVFTVSRACPPAFVPYSSLIERTSTTQLEMAHDDLQDFLESLDTNEDFRSDGGLEEESLSRDYTVRAVVMDQLWTHQELGDRRIDLRIVRKDLTQGDPSIEAWLVAPDIPSLDSFLQAAERSGWRVRTIPPKNPRERGVDLDLALGEILGRLERGAVILISNFTDMIGSAENLGWEVILESDIEQYVI